MPYSTADALTDIQALTNPTVQDIKNIVAQVDIDIPEGNTVYLYSGEIDETPAWQIIENIQVNDVSGKTSFINDTGFSELFEHPDFQSKLATAIINDPNPNLTLQEVMFGEDASGNRVNNTSFWDVASDNLAANQLVLEVQVQPVDIDVVEPGLESRVVFSAYKSRRMPLLTGRVTQVSADAFHEQQGAQSNSYYTARVEVDGKELDKLDTKVKLYPGMPADVFINTGTRTFLGYLFSPLSDSLHQAFKEE